MSSGIDCISLFQSTPSVGRATRVRGAENSLGSSFQSTPSVGRATTASVRYALTAAISIHALRGEGDKISANRRRARRNHFNPRPPWGGRLCCITPPCSLYSTFQSTPSVGRATTEQAIQYELHQYFNPRPPWGGRPLPQQICYRNGEISIHALRGEGDKLPAS